MPGKSAKQFIQSLGVFLSLGVFILSVLAACTNTSNILAPDTAGLATVRLGGDYEAPEAVEQVVSVECRSGKVYRVWMRPHPISENLTFSGYSINNNDQTNEFNYDPGEFDLMTKTTVVGHMYAKCWPQSAELLFDIIRHGETMAEGEEYGMMSVRFSGEEVEIIDDP